MDVALHKLPVTLVLDRAGITGNDGANMDVARHYPASFPLDNIVTVGSTTRNETLATSSNFGAAVDLLAPGEAILSLGYTGPTATATLSGTSMAAPHVAGALALLKARFPTDTYRQLINRLGVIVMDSPQGATWRLKEPS